MKLTRRIALAFLLAVITGAIWLGYAWTSLYRGFPVEGALVEIPQGASIRAIARLLEEKGVVRSSVAFELLCRARPRRKPQAGEYFFADRISALDVFRHIVEGRVFHRPLVIPEGKTIFQTADLVAGKEWTTREAFLAATRDVSAIADLAPGVATLEGFLFPARYEFPRSTDAAEIAAAMTRRFREVWESLPTEGANPYGLSVRELVTLASLVERETAVADERPLIAGVFYNRLRRGIALQCDPTVIYAHVLAGTYDGVLTRADLRIRSPYNTYRHRGLPPGPIANPGEESLRAVLFPPRVDYYYFVSNAQGGHFFSRTLAEHNRNVARYRRLLAQNSPGNATGNAGSPPTKNGGKTGGKSRR